MLKKLFNTISLRERFLLLTLIWIFVFLWMASLWEGFQGLRADMRQTQNALKKQTDWFARGPGIESSLQEALARLDPGKTYNSLQLSSKLETFALASSLDSPNIGESRTQASDVFNIHTVSVRLKKANIANLITFERKIREETPYLGLEKVKIFSNKADPRQLEAHFVVSSFELKNRLESETAVTQLRP